MLSAKKLTVLVTALAFHLCSESGSFSLPAPQVEWTLDLVASLSSTPVLFTDGGTPAGVLVGTGGRVFRLDGAGNLVWEGVFGPEATRGGIFDPVLADLDGDEKFEVVCAHNDGLVAALEGDTGAVRWTYDLGEEIGTWRMPNAADLDGDGISEVLATDMGGWVTCLSGGGELLWRTRTQDYRLSTPAIADIDQDGEPEIVFGSATRYLTALETDGTLLWESFQPPLQLGRTKPLIADLDGDGSPEICSLSSMIGRDTGLVCLNGGDGLLKWTAATWHKAYGGLGLIPSREGLQTVLACDKGNNVAAYNPDGTLRWRTQVSGRGIWTAPAVGDLDGDGTREAVATCRGQSLDGKGNSWYILSADTGEVLGAYPSDNGQYGGPLIADIDGDGAIELVLVSESGKVTAYSFGPKTTDGPPPVGVVSEGLYPVRVSHPKEIRKAAPPTVELLREQPPLRYGDNRLKVPLPQGVRASEVLLEVSVTGPSGKKTTRVFREEDPNDDGVGAIVPIYELGVHSLTLRLLSLQGQEPIGTETLAVEILDLAAPFQTHLSQALTDLQKARKLAREKNPESERTLVHRIADLEAGFSALRARLSNSADLTDVEQRKLAAKAEDLLWNLSLNHAFLSLWNSEIQAGRTPSFTLWQDFNPWDNTDPKKETPLKSEALVIETWAFGNETESVCANVLNLSPDPLTLRLDPGTLTGPEGTPENLRAEDIATLHRPVFLPSKFGETVPDLLPEMGNGYLIDLAPGQVRQIWVNLKTKGLLPGDYALAWNLRTLDPLSTTRELRIDLKVSSVCLPEKSRYLLNCWSSNKIGDFSTVPDLNEHLQTLWYRIALPPAPQANAEGEIEGDLDWAAHDAVLSQASQIELILYSGFPTPAFPQGTEVSEDLLIRAKRNYLAQVLARHAGLGLGYENFMIYVEDEPGLTGSIDHYLERAKEIKAIDPRLQVYANPWGSITKENIEEMWPVTDVWQPGMETIEFLGPEYVDAMRPGGKRISTYTPPGNVRVLRPLGFYRGQAWLALHWGIEGGGWWVYHQDDLWAASPEKEPAYGAVAFDGRELVGSRRWEANRDGVEDFNAVRLLQDALAAKPEPSAQRVLEEAIAYVVKETLTGMPREAADYDFDYLEFMKHRTAIRDALERAME